MRQYQDLRIPAISVEAIRESPLHLGLDKAICVSPKYVGARARNRPYNKRERNCIKLN